MKAAIESYMELYGNTAVEVYTQQYNAYMGK